MKVHIKSKHCNEEVELSRVGSYVDGSPAIKAFNLNGAPMFTATVCVDEKPADGCVFLKGWSENKWIPEALVAAGIVELTGRTCPTGYCEAIEARLLVEL